MTESDRIRIFCHEIWAWFNVHKRTLPWRDLKTKDIDQKAYLVLVSEIMLQQTQVPRVIILYKQFIQKFSHMKALSKASNSEILIAWRGLGYNNRALRLRDAAKIIVAPHPDPLPRGEGNKSKGFNGRFPSSMEDLQSIGGIGHYTAAAVRNFAFGIPTPCLDTNIRRILHRFFVGPENPDGTWKKDDKHLLALAARVQDSALAMKKGTCADWNAALMDFGSAVCTKNNPKWLVFTQEMKSICMAYGKQIKRTKKLNKQEPGRMMAGRFVPNRIFRGNIVEALRDAKKPLTLSQLGSQAIPDWTMGDHREWLTKILSNLRRDELIQSAGNKFRLKN